MGRRPRKRAPSLVSPTTQKELETLKGSMKANTARHLAEEQCAEERTRRRPRTPSPRRPKSTVFTRLAGEEAEAAEADAVAAYLKRCNHVRVGVPACVVRRDVAFESAEVATLPRDQLVVVEEERLLGDERRVRLSAPCIGWVSRRCLVVSEDLLNERKLRTLVCVSGADLPLFGAWLRFYRRWLNSSRELHVGFYDDEAYTYLPVRKSTSDLGIIAETFVILHAIEPTRLRRQRRVDGVESPRCRADAATDFSPSRRWRGAPKI